MTTTDAGPPTSAAASAEMAKKSSGALRLRYEVVYVSSEDGAHPASELVVPETTGVGMTSGQGWISKRFPTYPQILILELERRSIINQMQFLSHQSAISTKLELYVSVEGPRTPYDPVQDPDGCDFIQSIPFRRLGYLSLDSNEKSQWLARELKSVFVDCEARFIQIKLHKCHVNTLNLQSQVGLIAVNILGKYLDPPPPPPVLPSDDAIPPPMVALPVLHSVDAEAGLHQSSGWPPSGGPEGLGFDSMGEHFGLEVPPVYHPPPSTGDFSPLGPEGIFGTEADPETQKQIDQLLSLKQRAVEVEDYDEAMRLKDEITRLQGVSRALAELERSKRIAVQEEDYPRAKALKEEIHRLRTNGAAAQPPPRQSQTVYEPRYQYYHQHGGHSFQTPLSGVSGRTTPMGVSGADAYNTSSRSRPVNTHDEMPAVAGGGGSNQHRSILEAGPNSLPSEYLGQDPYYAVATANTTPPTAAAPIETGGTPKTPPLGGDRGPHPDLPDVPNSEALPAAEILPPAVAHEAQGAPMTLLGEYIIRCIVSKDWRVREAGFIQAEHDLEKGVWADKGDAVSGAHAAIYAVRKCVTDKIANVFLPCMRLLQAAANSVFNEMVSSMPRGSRDLHAILEPLMPALTDRLSDPNKRCQESTRNAILAIAVNVGPSFATHHVLKITARRGAGGRAAAAPSLLPNKALSARCDVLQAVIDTCGLVSTDAGGVAENAHGSNSIFTAPVLLTMAFDLLKQCPASEVRSSAVSLAAKVCSLVGRDAIKPFIKGIERQSQREAIETEIDRILNGRRGSNSSSSKSAPRRRPQTQDSRPNSGLTKEQQPAAAPTPVVCQFCGYSDPEFANQSDLLDLHYWRDCPSLTQCYGCGQVVELAGLAEHRAVECEAAAAGGGRT
ncbi:hypothetical protein FOZ63_012109 [Perkinsus olseni]|uniref:UVR domain-containing protein n=1 Tax=Perkinsus olseni TaxID=32597 RepID=A0A7J6TRF1_PEROL|nr:hypothetical protein FOZ63_012109 [Perkinsus olseni]KAF4746970.1 hypothetical protein FOZ62_007818 [Perkinsus olseni]